MADPDLQGGGGGRGHPDPGIKRGPGLKNKLFSALRASFWSKNKEGAGPPCNSLGSATDIYISRASCSFGS